jgi:hypothetical protein
VASPTKFADTAAIGLADRATLAAAGGAGKIQLTGVEGQIYDDGTTTFDGIVSSNGTVAGPCP